MDLNFCYERQDNDNGMIKTERNFFAVWINILFTVETPFTSIRTEISGGVAALKILEFEPKYHTEMGPVKVWKGDVII